MQAHSIQVEAEVRYWEDAKVNGQEDVNGDLIPFRKGSLWCPRIRLEDGQFIDWPQGTTARIHYKVCDQGLYWLTDEAGNRVAKWKGYYVPDSFLCHGRGAPGYGDYIIMTVGADGLVEGWRTPGINDDDDEDSGWEAIGDLLDSEPELWTAMCGDWREETVAIHGERSGLIASGLPSEQAYALIKAHNQGRERPVAAATPAAD